MNALEEIFFLIMLLCCSCILCEKFSKNGILEMSTASNKLVKDNSKRCNIFSIGYRNVYALVSFYDSDKTKEVTPTVIRRLTYPTFFSTPKFSKDILVSLVGIERDCQRVRYEINEIFEKHYDQYDVPISSAFLGKAVYFKMTSRINIKLSIGKYFVEKLIYSILV
jgi:hypothetical protein